MKIECLHGFFKFKESRAGEVAEFASIFELDMVRRDDYFTFEELEAAPEYSIKGGELLNLVATKTFAGNPWDIFRENNVVYNFNLGLLQLISSVTDVIELPVGRNYFLSNGLIMPGSLMDGGLRVKDYAAWFSSDTMKFKYSEVNAE